MNVSDLRKILNQSRNNDAEIEFEHGGQKSRVTGYTVEKNVDGSTKAILLKTAAHEAHRS